MASQTTSVVGRIAYGSVFVIALPLTLIAWAMTTEDVVHLPALHWPIVGVAAAAAGFAFMCAGWYALFMHGDGLPMNAFPPHRFVRVGVYRYLNHPIYLGFALACFGVALFFGSASGFWLVSPVATLGTLALVFGYERHDLLARFGAAARTRPLIAIPDASDAPTSVWQRVAVFLLVIVPWILAYEAVQLAGVPRDAIRSFLPFEARLPVFGWTEAIYATPYLAIPFIPLLARTRRQLRDYALNGLFATAFVTFIYIVVPLVAPPRPFTPHTWLDLLLASERVANNTVAAFPAFHVIWALIAARTLAQIFTRYAWLAWLWAGAVTVSCITTGMHSIVDVAAAWPAYEITVHRAALWEVLRRGAEKLANSWHEWRVGRIRIINHGVYAALGAFVGSYIAGIVSGAPIGAVLFVGACTLLGAGAWAQALEGSPILLRPFGYYGAIIGGIIGCAVAAIMIDNPILLLAGFAVGAPWVQALGRMRCLVQGCCHGRPAPDQVGIRYAHKRSRVTHIAGLRGVPIHPTPLYSILSNIVTGLLLARFWTLGASPALVLGLYLILNPIARFVEESYRGEPQTPIVLGLRVYQWMAALSILAGIIATTIPAPPAPPIVSWFAPSYALVALALGLAAGMLMGVDLPASNARFSRLAPT